MKKYIEADLINELKGYKNNPGTITFFSDVIVRQETKESFIIGRINLNRYIEIPAIGAEIICLLKKGQEIYKIKENLEDKYSTKLEIIEFVEKLIHLNFVRSVNNIIWYPQV